MNPPFGTDDKDKTQLGLSEQAVADRDTIQNSLALETGLDAYRLAIAVALAKNLPAASETVRRTNAYGVASLDPDGSLRAAAVALRDDAGGRPYALIERLAESGLRDLAAHLDDGLPLRQYLSVLVPPKAR